jgi:hypothetical protein
MASKYPVLYWRVALGLCGLMSLIWPLRKLSFAQERVPDWTTWQCKNAIISFDIIETRECHPPGDAHSDCIILELKGAHIPFLIGWGRNELAKNPGASEYTALYKNGKWIVGVRGTGFTTEDRKASIIFYIFLRPDFSVREQIEIKVPEGKGTTVPS